MHLMLGCGVKPHGADQGGDLSNIWNVVLAGGPYGLGVVSFNMGKHIDKHDDDKATGVGRALPAEWIRLQ